MTFAGRLILFFVVPYLDENGVIPVRMIKLEPDIDTRYYGGYDSYARPQVKMETDDDYYANYEDDEDYFPKVCSQSTSTFDFYFVYAPFLRHKIDI